MIIKTALLFFILLLQLSFFQLRGIELFENQAGLHASISMERLKFKQPCCLLNWKRNTILDSTQRKSARTAILIIAPPTLGNGNVENRWKLGKKVWEHYMNSQQNVDCYFVQCTYPKNDSSEQVWIEGNTIYVGDVWYEQYQQDRILHKTIKALELLLPKNYTHYIRTNLNTFINLKNANDYMETHQQSFYTAPIWETAWYTLGYGIIFTANVGKHILNEYLRLEKANEELISCDHSDDCALTSLATGVWPYNESHPFRGFAKLPCGVRQLMCRESFDTTRLSRYGVFLSPLSSVEEGIGFIDQANDKTILYRTRDGLNLDQIAKLYEYLLNKNYPELPYINLIDYLRSIE